MKNPFSETTLELFQADDNTRLLSHCWLPAKKPKAILLGIHGAMIHGGDWVTPALFFKNKDIATYALDLRWHGTFPQYNPGTEVIFHMDKFQDHVNDIFKYWKWIRAKHSGVPMFVICHSFGGLIGLTFGLTKAHDTDISGFIVSSPWLVNKVKVNPVLEMLADVLSVIKPRHSIELESILDKLTHDKKILARHRADEAAGLRSSRVTTRCAAESKKAQRWVLNNLSRWNTYPVYAVIAGEDHLADCESSVEALRTVRPGLMTLTVHQKNYHENFNEVNREDIFKDIFKWMKSSGGLH